MKQVIKLGINRYIHLDSYGESYETRPIVNFLVFLLATGIGAMTVGATVGVDITNFNSTNIQRIK
jgi:hypothetical protein